MATKPTMQFSNPNTSVLVDIMQIPGSVPDGMVLVSAYMPMPLALDIAQKAITWNGESKAPEDRRFLSYNPRAKMLGWSFRHPGRSPEYYVTFAEAKAARDAFLEHQYIYDSGKRRNPFQVTIRGKYVGQYPTLFSAKEARDKALLLG